MPVVFAIQHPVPADYQGVQEYLGLDVKWSLVKIGDSDDLVDYGFRDVRWVNYTESEAHFVVDYTNKLDDGLFAVTWSITTKNFSADPLITDNFGFYVSTNVTFIVKKGAPQPDFVAAAGLELLGRDHRLGLRGTASGENGGVSATGKHGYAVLSGRGGR